MPQTSMALEAIPPAATQALRALGENLAIARTRRRESQRAWAKRLGVSVPTLIRMERGDPGVGAGIYATALRLMGTVSGLPELAAPATDRGALESDVRTAVQRRAVRSTRLGEACLGRKANQSRKFHHLHTYRSSVPLAAHPAAAACAVRRAQPPALESRRVIAICTFLDA